MTTPATFDMTSNGPATHLVRAAGTSDTTIHLPARSERLLGPYVEIDEERLTFGTASEENRAAMTLAAVATTGDTTVTVNDVGDVDANPALGITNNLEIGALEAVTVVSSSGTTLTLSAPLANGHSSGAAVEWVSPGGSAVPHKKSVVTVTRGDAPAAHVRWAQVSHVYRVDDLLTVARSREPYTFLAVGDVTMEASVAPGVFEASRGNLRFLQPSVASKTFQVRVAMPSYLSGMLPAQSYVGVTKVANADGSIITSPATWYAVGTMAYSNGDSAYVATYTTGDSDPATADLQVTGGLVEFRTAGWYQVDVHCTP